MLSVPRWMIPKPNSHEDIVWKYFKERLPKEWRVIIEYHDYPQMHVIRADWINGKEHFGIDFALPDLKEKFEKPPDRYAQGIMALAKVPDYVPQLTEKAKEDFDKMIAEGTYEYFRQSK